MSWQVWAVLVEVDEDTESFTTRWERPFPQCVTEDRHEAETWVDGYRRMLWGNKVPENLSYEVRPA